MEFLLDDLKVNKDFKIKKNADAADAEKILIIKENLGNCKYKL